MIDVRNVATVATLKYNFKPTISHPTHSTMNFLPSFILSDESKERLTKFFNLTHTVAHYGWIPFVLYLGWSQTSNKPNLLNLLSPLPSV